MPSLKSLLKSLPAILVSVIAVVGITYAAGSLTAPSGTPTNTSYTLDDVYNLASSGATTTVGSGAIPSTPGAVSATFHSLADVYGAVNSMVKSKPLRTWGTSGYCADINGNVISCAGTGLEAEFNAGVPRSYTDNSNGTISDNATGLMWQKCPLGQSGPSCGTGTPTAVNFMQATSTCADLVLGGQSDWRLPSRFELESILALEKSPAIHQTYFPNLIPNDNGNWKYFSSSVGSDPKLRYDVDFLYGVAEHFFDNSWSVRCVRGGL